jgi:flagellar hook-length control protein FliK
MPALNAAANTAVPVGPSASVNGLVAGKAEEPANGPFKTVLQQQMTDSKPAAGNRAADSSGSGTASEDAQSASTTPADPSQAALLPLVLGSPELAAWVAANLAQTNAAPATSATEQTRAATASATLTLPTVAGTLAADTLAVATTSVSPGKASGPSTLASNVLAALSTGATPSTAQEGRSSAANAFAPLTNTPATLPNDKPVASSTAIVAGSPEIVAANTKPPPTAVDNIEQSLAAATAAGLTHAPPITHASSTARPVETPVGAIGWDTEIGNHVAWMANNQQGRAELVLTPPQLGRIEISLTVSGDQANAMFISANPAVRDQLESALPRLREILADAGITLGQAQVGSESSGQSANNGENRDNSPRGVNAGFIGDSATARIATSVANPWSATGRGMVDIFA